MGLNEKRQLIYECDFCDAVEVKYDNWHLPVGWIKFGVPEPIDSPILVGPSSKMAIEEYWCGVACLIVSIRASYFDTLKQLQTDELGEL